jgi:FkbM family methyltransferase
VNIFLDIGANIGWYTTLIAKTFPNSACHSFEPHPLIYSALSENVKVNNLNNVSINNIGLSDSPGTATLNQFAGLGHGHSSIEKVEKKVNNTFDIELTTLDSYIKENDIKNIDLIKIDVEGAELDVLRGSTSMMTKNQPVWVIEMNKETAEKFHHQPQDLLRFLEKYNGYEYYRVQSAWGKVYRMESIDDYSHGDNVICIPKNNIELIKKASSYHT